MTATPIKARPDGLGGDTPNRPSPRSTARTPASGLLPREQRGALEKSSACARAIVVDDNGYTSEARNFATPDDEGDDENMGDDEVVTADEEDDEKMGDDKVGTIHVLTDGDIASRNSLKQSVLIRDFRAMVEEFTKGEDDDILLGPILHALSAEADGNPSDFLASLKRNFVNHDVIGRGRRHLPECSGAIVVGSIAFDTAVINIVRASLLECLEKETELMLEVRQWWTDVACEWLVGALVEFNFERPTDWFQTIIYLWATIGFDTNHVDDRGDRSVAHCVKNTGLTLFFFRSSALVYLFTVVWHCFNVDPRTYETVTNEMREVWKPYMEATGTWHPSPSALNEESSASRRSPSSN